jgi:hypothetical protein
MMRLNLAKYELYDRVHDHVTGPAAATVSWNLVLNTSVGGNLRFSCARLSVRATRLMAYLRKGAYPALSRGAFVIIAGLLVMHA